MMCRMEGDEIFSVQPVDLLMEMNEGGGRGSGTRLADSVDYLFCFLKPCASRESRGHWRETFCVFHLNSVVAIFFLHTIY